MSWKSVLMLWESNGIVFYPCNIRLHKSLVFFGSLMCKVSSIHFLAEFCLLKYVFTVETTLSLPPSLFLPPLSWRDLTSFWRPPCLLKRGLWETLLSFEGSVFIPHLRYTLFAQKFKWAFQASPQGYVCDSNTIEQGPLTRIHSRFPKRLPLNKTRQVYLVRLFGRASAATLVRISLQNLVLKRLCAL